MVRKEPVILGLHHANLFMMCQPFIYKNLKAELIKHMSVGTAKVCNSLIAPVLQKNNVSDLLCTENAYSQAPSPLPLLTLRIHENVKHIAAQRERCCPSHVPKINDCITFIISNLCAALSVFLTMSCPSFAASINSHQNLLPL